MSESIPEFGEKIAGAAYTDRPGAYGVIRDDAGRIAVVAAMGGYYLPGGGIDSGESPEAALQREAREECGRNAIVLRPIGRAIQYVVTRSGKPFAKQCQYFEASFEPGFECEPTEPGHVLEWFTVADAMNRLSLEADVWAITRVTKVPTQSPRR